MGIMIMIFKIFIWGGICVALKLYFRRYIRQYTSPNESFECNYPPSDFVIILYGKEHCVCAAVIAVSTKPCIIVVILFEPIDLDLHFSLI